jgi:YfiH family protein
LSPAAGGGQAPLSRAGFGPAPVFEARLPGARAVFTTRVGGVSSGPYESLNLGILTDDDPERVRENRRRALQRAGVERFAMGHQVHGTDLAEWDGPSAEPLQQVDAHATAVPGLGLLVLVADCLPLALAGPERVAVLHCGWRGLAAGIVERALATFPNPPAAALGPCIGRCCYEVGPEVLDAFADLEGVADGRMLDLRAVAEARLRAGGVDSVEHVDLCTSCNPDLLFSHRRDRGVTGRQCGIVVRA